MRRPKPDLTPLCWWRIVLLWAMLAVDPCDARTTLHTDPEYLIDTWETEDGLPENSATAMVQSADGYLWFGTFAGLVRFDGVKFNSVKVPGHGTGVINVHFDRAERLWVSNYSGLSVLEGGRWRDTAVTDGWTGDVVRTFSERSDGALLMTTFEGKIFEFSNGRFTALPHPPGGMGAFLGAVDESEKWCVARTGFFGKWDGVKWMPLVPAENLQGPGSDSIGLASARGGGLWLLLGKELRKFRNGVETARVSLTKPTGGAWSLFEDSADHLWISSYDGGLSRVSVDGATRHWTAADGVHHARRFVFEDREGNLWAGSSGGGLQRFKPRRFRAYGPGNGIVERNISSIALDRGVVWVGTYGGGLFRMDYGRAVQVEMPGATNVQSVLTDQTGRTWVGTLKQGLWVIENGTPRRLPDEQTAGGNVVALFEDSRGRIWLSGGGSVTVFDGASVRMLPPVESVTCIGEDSAGSIILGNYKGAWRIEGERYVEMRFGDTAVTNIACVYSRAPSDATSGGKQHDDLWIYSVDLGLLRLRDGKLSRVPYSGAVVYGIIEEREGLLWLHTERGVVRWSWSGTGAPETIVFDASDGLPSNECSNMRQPVCTRAADGTLWFATLKGAASINPARFRPNSVAPPVHFESLVYRVLRDGREIETRLDAPFALPLVLPPDSRRLEFHFTAPGFTAPEKMQFAMQLDEDKVWQAIGTRRFIEFYEQPPGVFTLHVRAANNDGVWSAAPAVLSFTVQPHYWQTAWFRTAGVLTLLALGGGWVWWFMRFRHARMEEKLALQQQRGELAHLGRVASMSELSGSLAHELNQPLTAILSNAQAAQRFIEQDPPDLAEVREILTDIVSEDRRAGEVIRRMRGMLKKGETVMEVLQLNALAEEVLAMIRSDLVARNISVTAEFAPGLPPVYGDRVQIQQVILNLLVNACDAMADTHDADRVLTVAVRAADGRVVLTVRDRGHGLAPGAEEAIFVPFYTTKTGGLGMGLAICRSIVTAHAGRLTARNHPDGGAVLRMELPLHTEKPHD